MSKISPARFYVGLGIIVAFWNIIYFCEKGYLERGKMKAYGKNNKLWTSNIASLVTSIL